MFLKGLLFLYLLKSQMYKNVNKNILKVDSFIVLLFQICCKYTSLGLFGCLRILQQRFPSNDVFFFLSKEPLQDA